MSDIRRSFLRGTNIRTIFQAVVTTSVFCAGQICVTLAILLAFALPFAARPAPLTKLLVAGL